MQLTQHALSFLCGLTALALAPATAQTVLADYPLANDLFDASGNQAPISLTGNPTPPAPPSNGVCVNGIYASSTGGQDVRTPNIATLNANDFQIEVDFQLAGLPPTTYGSVLMAGNGWRWIGIYMRADGTVGLKYNNSNFAWSSTVLGLNQWYRAVVKFENGLVQLFVDDALILQQMLGALNTGNNLNFTTNDYSNARNHNGCIRNLRISNDTDLEFHRAATGCAGLTIATTGSPTAGNTVQFTLGGPISTSATLFGLAPARIPVCPMSGCELGLVQLGAIAGTGLAFTIPGGLPSGVGVFVQGIAITPGGCLVNGTVNVGTTDTVQMILQ